MSLESLQALKSLVQVREQGASIQGDNLEQVQSKVQQLGTSEAKRVDDLHLETAKAQYEVSLTQAKIERLASQLVRENKAVQNANLITIGVAALSIGTNAGFFFSDVTGKNKLGDTSKGESLNGFNFGGENGSKTAKTTQGSSGAQLTQTSGQDANGAQAVIVTNVSGVGGIGEGAGGKSTKLNATDDNIGDIKKKLLDTKAIDENGSITKKGAELKLGTEGQVLSFANTGAAQKSLQDAGLVGKDGSVTKRGDSFGLSALGKVESNTGGGVVRVSILSQADIAQAAKDAGVTKGSGKNGSFTLEDIRAKDPNAADALIKSKSRDVRRDESGSVLDAISKKTNNNSENVSAVNANLLTGDRRKGITAEESLRDRVQNHLEATGVHESGLKKTGDVLKSGANALVSIASDVSPFYQAYLKMKTQRDNTADELQAEVAKLAAERKKLKALELAIQSPGAGEEGSGAGEASKAKA